MRTLAERLRWARNSRKLTQQQLSDLTNGEVSQQVIAKLEKEEPKNQEKEDKRKRKKRTSFIIPLANALKYDLEWLGTGKGTPEQSIDTTSPLSIAQHKIPLIEWQFIDQYLKVCLNHENIKEVPHQEITIVLPESEILGRNCFALTVMGDAMIPDKCQGDWIVIDPDKIPSPKKTVLFKSETDNKYKLRQYSQEDGEFFLKAINKNKNEYPTIPYTNDIKISGVIVYTIKKE